MNADVCIIGAGLSGAYIARILASHNISVYIIDALNRVGGRLLTASSGDLGGSWIWPRSEPNMANLLQSLGIDTVPMHMDGISMACTSDDGTRHVIANGQAAMYAACGSGAVRVRGGASKVVSELLRSVSFSSIQLGLRVTEIDYNDAKKVKIKCERRENDGVQDDEEDITAIFHCKAVVLAAPPKVLANTIKFTPNLPQDKVKSMLVTPTWMEEYSKVAVSFPRNWWRQLCMSGISIDHAGAVQTWWEACSGIGGDGEPTLAGFVTKEGADMLKFDDPVCFFKYISESLKRIYGVDVMENSSNEVKAYGSYTDNGLVVTNGDVTVTYKSWLEDDFTNAKSLYDAQGLDFSCDYGDIELQRCIGPLFFAGTETAAGAHGHMEGALTAAERSAEEILSYLSYSTPGK